MEHSKNFKKVKDYYDDKLWDERRVRLAVGRWITAEEYKEITGKDYEQCPGSQHDLSNESSRV